MEENLREKNIKEARLIKEKTAQLRKIKDTRLDEAFSAVAQSWSGEAAQKLLKKSSALFGSLDNILSTLDCVGDELLEKISE